MSWLFAVVIVVVVTADLVTKFTIDGILNPGIAWGLGAQLPWLWVVIVVLSLVMTVLLFWWWMHDKRTVLRTLGLAFMISGILGNAIDRIVSGGAVHDFIDFMIFKNNLADIAITVGVILTVLSVLREAAVADR